MHTASLFCRRAITRETLQLIADQLNTAINCCLDQKATKIVVSFPNEIEENDPDDSLFHIKVEGTK